MKIMYLEYKLCSPWLEKIKESRLIYIDYFIFVWKEKERKEELIMNLKKHSVNIKHRQFIT